MNLASSGDIFTEDLLRRSSIISVIALVVTYRNSSITKLHVLHTDSQELLRPTR